MSSENFMVNVMFVRRAGCAWPERVKSGERLKQYKVLPPAQSAIESPLSSANTPGLPNCKNMLKYSLATVLVLKLGVYGVDGTGIPLMVSPHSTQLKCWKL